MRIEPLNLGQVAGAPVISLDVETTGLHWYRDKMFGLAIATYDPTEGVLRSGYWDTRDWPASRVSTLSRDISGCRVIANHNVKFDCHFLREAGFQIPLDRIECTGVRAALIDEHRRSYSLDALAIEHVGRGKETGVYEKLAELFGGKPTKEVQMKNLHRAPEKLAREYARTDPELAIQLWLWQNEEIERQELQSVWDLERRLTPVLVDVEQHGIRVDVDRATAAMVDLNKHIAKAQRALNKLAGKEVNANSAPQMRALFVTGQKEKRWYADNYLLESTDGGEASIGKDALMSLKELGNDMAGHVLTIRKMTKAISFCKDHILGHEVNGRVYPNYNQTKGDNDLGTGTGRFSMDDPAMQQIPKRDREIAAIVRSCFLPEKGHEWACADWEQFEFRWFAHFAKDPSILAAYAKDAKADFHQMTADLTGLPRSARYAGDANAKQINLGLVFGMGPGKMAQEMGLDYTVREGSRGREWIDPGEKAQDIFAKYHAAIPGVKKILEQAGSIARARGYVKTVMGRHIRFPHGQFTHKAGGLVFQGSSADCMKLKMIELHPIAKKEGFHLLLSVHDEADFSIPTKMVKRVGPVIKSVLETFDGEKCPIRCRVPILSDVNFGPNWWEACK